MCNYEKLFSFYRKLHFSLRWSLNFLKTRIVKNRTFSISKFSSDGCKNVPLLHFLRSRFDPIWTHSRVHFSKQVTFSHWQKNETVCAKIWTWENWIMVTFNHLSPCSHKTHDECTHTHTHTHAHAYTHLHKFSKVTDAVKKFTFHDFLLQSWNHLTQAQFRSGLELSQIVFYRGRERSKKALADFGTTNGF